MAISVVQSKAFGGASSGSLNAAVTDDSTLFYIAQGFSGASSSSPLYNGSTPTGTAKLAEASEAGGNVYNAIWMLPAVAGGGTSVAITITNGNNGFIVIEVAGLGASPALDSGGGTSTGTGSTGSTAINSGNITLGGAPDILFGTGAAFGVGSGSYTTPSGGGTWVALPNASFSTSWYQVAASSGGTFGFDTSDGSGTNAWAASIAAVTATASGASVSLTTPNLALDVPLVTPQFPGSVSLTTPNLALSAPLLAPAGSGAATVALTTPNLALSAPLIQPGNGSGGGGSELLALGILLCLM